MWWADLTVGVGAVHDMLFFIVVEHLLVLRRIVLLLLHQES
jgi:hypothetical protein